MRKFLLVVAVIGVSCVSEESADKKWDKYVADHNSCSDADECVVIFPGCPLGCATAVAAEFEEDAKQKAEKIISSYERGGRACAYDCIETGPVICAEGTCQISDILPGADPCEGKMCGESCSTCTSNACPAVEEYCQLDGTCSSDLPVCD